jgi:hypothetical protein
MRKVAGYVRVSSEEQSREGISLDAQRARIVAYCAVRGLDLVQLARQLRGKPFTTLAHQIDRIRGDQNAVLQVTQCGARPRLDGAGLPAHRRPLRPRVGAVGPAMQCGRNADARIPARPQVA